MANEICKKYIEQQIAFDVATWSYYSRIFQDSVFDRTPVEAIPAAQFQCEYMKDHLKKSSTIFASTGIANLPSCGNAAACTTSGTSMHNAAITAINADSTIYNTIMADYRYPPCYYNYGTWEAKHYLMYQSDLATDADLLSDYLFVLNSTTLISGVYNLNMANAAAPSTLTQEVGKIAAYTSAFALSTTELSAGTPNYRDQIQMLVAYKDEPIIY